MRALLACLLLLTACAQAPQVWVIDDGERIGRRDRPTPLMEGRDNPVWAPGQPVRLFALPGETVAVQVVVRAGWRRLSGVTVDLPMLRGPGPGIFADIERFVTHDVPVRRRSGGKDRGESLGWAAGSMPTDNDDGRAAIPDPLIPVERAPRWADYPMTVPRREQRVVWIDITVPDLPDQRPPPGLWRGQITVASSDGSMATITIPVELAVGPVPLPYAAARTMVYYEPQEIAGRTADPASVHHYLQLMHRHHLSPVYRVNTVADVRAQRAQLTGTLFTSAEGYSGPGMGRAADVIAIGTYGSLGEPTPARVAQVQGIVHELDSLGVLDHHPDVFLYAADEQCDSGLGPAWRAALRSVTPPVVKVGHTCARNPADPAGPQVDLAIVPAGAYDTEQARAARAMGRMVWIYNGTLPRTGSFLLDGGALSLRANGWIQARFGIDRWFYWESTFWNDDNRGGQGPYDPYLVAETFHNRAGDHANGDGVLVYPGRQGRPFTSDLGFSGVIASFRLKQWRRGISDAGYLQLALAIDRARASRAAAALIPWALQQAGPLSGAPFPLRGAPFFAARKQLFEIITGAR